MSRANANHGAELLTLAEARAGTYAFLSGAFGEPPSVQAIGLLRADSFLESAGETFGEAAAGLLARWAGTTEPNEALTVALRREFMELFKVPGPRYTTPYESVFHDSREVAGRQVKGLLMGQSALDVQKWYRLAALEIAPVYQDLPDHIGLELHYLSQLCAREREFDAKAETAKLHRAWEMERDFLRAHVVSWVGALREKIRAKTQSPYYLAIAEMVDTFTRRDLATLEETMGPSEGRSVPAYTAVATE